MCHSPSSDPEDRLDNIITPHGIMQLIPHSMTLPNTELIPPEEQLEASQRYIQGVYDAMIHRRTDGSDPLVQEPGP